MRYFSTVLFCFLSISLFAQFGVTIGGVTGNVASQNISRQLDLSPEIAVNYWFRLKNKRIEFQPTVYGALVSSADNDAFTELGLQFKTNFYLFDLGGDCDCPTFGKQGPNLQKGFFIQLSPGIAYYDISLPGPMYEETAVGLTLGAALGLDFGINNLVTITPQAGIRKGFATVGQNVITDGDGMILRSDNMTPLVFHFGLQVSFRLDHKRY